MINDQVIKEIYKKFSKPVKSQEDLKLDYYVKLLNKEHNIEINDLDVVINDLDSINPFRRFLKRSIYAILEFDNVVAFVFRSHILFFSINDNQLRVHIKPEKPKGFFRRLFSKDDE